MPLAAQQPPPLHCFEVQLLSEQHPHGDTAASQLDAALVASSAVWHPKFQAFSWKLLFFDLRSVASGKVLEF